MRLWSRPLIVAGIGVVPQGPEEGPPTGTHSGPAQQNRPRGGRAWPGFETTRRANHQHTRLHWCGGRRRDRRARAGFEIDHSEPQARVWRSRGRDAAHRHQHADTNTQPQAHRHNEAARPHRGPGGSRVRPLGGSQRRVQRIWVPSEPRRWQASTTRAAMPASADLPHVRGSYCFFTPTSPSILRTPS